MSNWRLRSPDKFPPNFKHTLQAAWDDCLSNEKDVSDRFLLADGLTKTQARYVSDRFYCFRWCLRQYPLHPLHKIEADWEINLRTVVNGGEYSVWVIAQKRLSDDALIEALAGN